MNILINSPSLDLNDNVSGIASITNLIINNNHYHNYVHIEIGSRDNKRRFILRLFKVLKTYYIWLKTIQNEKFDILHFNLPFSQLSIIRDIPLILFAKKYINQILIHIHGGELLLKKKTSYIHKILVNLLLKNNFPLIVLSNIESQEFRKNYGYNNLIVLPNAVKIPENISLNGQIKNLLFMGRLEKSKGIYIVIKAFIELKKKFPELRLYICGAGSELTNIYKLIEENGIQDIFIEGVVSGSKKRSILIKSDILLLPSYYEGLPLVVLEAMSYGIIPIVTPVGSLPELIKHNFNGLICELDDYSDLALKIESLHYCMELSSKLSKNAYDSICNNYSIENYVKKLNNVYRPNIN